MVSAPTFTRPSTVEAALAALADGALAMAGGTDIYPVLVGREEPRHVVDLTAVEELRGIQAVGADGQRWWRVGASTTWGQLATAQLGDGFRAIRQAARQVGAHQVQQVATVAGNLCTASPAGDGIPVLIALGADVELRSASGTRRMPVAAFITGYRATALQPGELVVAVWLPVPEEALQSCFVKFATRSSLVISLAMVAAVITRDGSGSVTSAGVVVGACSPVAVHLRAVETDVLGGGAGVVTAQELAALSPIDDVRCSAAYRLSLVPELVRRALAGCGVA